MGVGQAELLNVTACVASYGQLEALHGVSISARAGEIVGIGGPNGAGKSTLLRVISGLIKAKSGEVSFNGAVLDWRRLKNAAALGIMHVPEGRGLFADLTVRDNLRLGAIATGKRKPDLRPIFTIFPQIANLSGRLASSLSGGEQQMVALGRALIAEPRLLLIDELSLGLAPKIIDDLYRTLGQLNQSTGTTMIIVDQRLDLLSRYAQRIYILDRGQVAIELRPDEAPLSEQVIEAYLGKA